MNNKVKVTGLLVGGYLLGRSKKLKLALTVAASVSGSSLYRNREQIQEAFGKFSESSPDFKNLQEKVTGRLVDQVGAKLQEQTDKINTSLDEAGSETAAAASEAAEDVTPEETTDEASEDQAGAESGPEEEPAEKPKQSTGKRASTKSTGTKSQSSSSTRKTAAKGGSSGSAKSSSNSSSRKTASSKSQGAKK